MRPAALAIVLGLVVGVLAPVAGAQKKASTADLIAALDAQDDEERSDAIGALAKQGEKIDGALRQVLRSLDSSPRARAGVIEVWGKRRRSGVKALEEQILQPVNVGTYNSVLFALNAIGDVGPAAEWAVPVLLDHFECKPERPFEEFYYWARGAAVEALGKVGTPNKKAARALREQLDVPSTYVRMSAACALWWTGAEPDEVRSILLEGIDSPDQQTRMRAFFGIGEMGPHAAEVVPALEERHAKASEHERECLGVALAKIRGARPPDGPRPFEQDGAGK